MSFSPEHNKVKCACEDEARAACEGEMPFGEYEGKGYCLLYLPSKEKLDEFAELMKRKLRAKSFDFRGAWFPEEISFKEFTFDDDANFAGSTFSGKVSFNIAVFLRKEESSCANCFHEPQL